LFCFTFLDITQQTSDEITGIIANAVYVPWDSAVGIVTVYRLDGQGVGV
jgi:hypothetical protein